MKIINRNKGRATLDLARPAPSREQRPVKLNVWEQLEAILSGIKLDSLCAELPILADWLSDNLPGEADPQTLQLLRGGSIRMTEREDSRAVGGSVPQSTCTLDNSRWDVAYVVWEISKHHWLPAFGQWPSIYPLLSYGDCSRAAFVTSWGPNDDDPPEEIECRRSLYLDIGKKIHVCLPALFAYIIYRLAGKVKPRLE